MKHLKEERFTATYRLEAASYEEAKKRSLDIAIEQTIEYPYDLIKNSWFATEMVGQIISLESLEAGIWELIISYPSEVIEGSLTQLINMIYGNSSLKPDLRLTDISLPSFILSHYKGPRFGLAGLRNIAQIPQGPMFMGAIKPIGRTSHELANMVYEFAKGGAPFIKDDHSLCNQVWAPFQERVAFCAEAVCRANAKTGQNSIYIANCTADGSQTLERAHLAKKLGAGAIMLSASLIGFSIIRELADDDSFNLPIILHPSFSGSYLLSSSFGISNYLYNGILPRLAGADAVISTGYGGRFGFSQQDSQLALSGVSKPLGFLKPCASISGGGITWQLFAELAQIYGPDIIFLVGGAIFKYNSNLSLSVEFFLKKLREAYSK